MLRTPTKSVVEYVWLDANGDFRSKCMTTVVHDGLGPGLGLGLGPWNYDGSSTGQATGKDSEVTINPVHTVPCPFRGEGHYVTLCETRDNSGKPLPGNHYVWAKDIFDRKEVQEAEPWYGLEQEYFITDMEGVPLGFQEACQSGKGQGQYYCSVGTGNCYGRVVSDQHYECCLKSGLHISGTNAEVAPGQWEFQIGPVQGINAAHELLLARYFLVRLTEYHNLKVTFHPKPEILRKGEWNGSGCHTNFSTKPMREGHDGRPGSDFITEGIKALSKCHSYHMKYYGDDNHLRMTGKCETSSYSEFTYGRANRGASVRVPNKVSKDKCGYFEDRRPASNCNPYLVTALIVSTVLGLDLDIPLPS